MQHICALNYFSCEDPVNYLSPYTKRTHHTKYKIVIKETISRKLWPSKGRYKTAVLTKSEVQKQFPNYFWFEPPVIPFNVPLIATSLTENIEQK